MEQPSEIRRKKQLIRREAKARRGRQNDRERLSANVFERLLALPGYASASAILCYVSFDSEVVTLPFLFRVWADGKRLVVPYCNDDRLGLFELQSLEELQPGTIGILEPAKPLHGLAGRGAEVKDLDLIVLPGLAFDRHGGRLGYGKGYYDRLLAEACAETALVAVAFECQMIDEVPMGEGDVRVDTIVTDMSVYHRDRPRRSSQTS